MVLVSVVIPVYKAGQDIKKCLNSLLNQTFRDFEIVIVEDPPTDETEQIIISLKDDRIRYIKNSSNFGLSKSREISIINAKGKYIFFTDSDCVAEKNWIQSGINMFNTFHCVGVEGVTYYVSKSYFPTFSDRVISNINGKSYNTCNMAYLKSVISEVGGFDIKFSYHEDRDLAFKILKIGDIGFNPEMIVFHNISKWNPLKYVKSGYIVKNRILLYKKFNDKYGIYGRILFPNDLIILLFPPLLLIVYLNHRTKFKSRLDWIILFLTYFKLWDDRINIWRESVKERVLLF